MELNDITNTPLSLRSSRTTSVHVRLPTEYAPCLRNVAEDEDSRNGRRAAGHTNIDLWVDGRLYPKDPNVQFPPTFYNLNSFLQYVGRGEKGLLGYCKRLSSNTTDAFDVILRQYQILYADRSCLQQQMLELQKEDEALKCTIKEKDLHLSKLASTIAHMKDTPLGVRLRKRNISSIESLAPKGGALKRRVMATR